MSSRPRFWPLVAAATWSLGASAQDVVPPPEGVPPPAEPAPPPPEPMPAPVAEPAPAAAPPPPAAAPDAYYASAPPPPPPQRPQEDFELPTLSFRVDPFNWLLNGRLGIEMEAELLPWLSVELVPVFIVNEQPPAFDIAFDDVATPTQHSNGLGALAGTSLGVGFWLSGKPLRGTVLRAIFTNYALTYRSNDDAGVIDELSHTERHFYGMLGSNATWGVFTLGGGIGLGVELNEQRRCFENGQVDSPTSDCSGDELLLALGREDDPPLADVNSSTHPIQILGRISLGVTF